MTLDKRRRLGRVAARIGAFVSVSVGIAMLALVVFVSDCGFAGGTCPDPDPSFDGGPFVLGMVAGGLITAPPLLLARVRWPLVAGITLVVALILGFGAATS